MMRQVTLIRNVRDPLHPGQSRNAIDSENVDASRPPFLFGEAGSAESAH
jgi:hypothetical protein